MKKRFYVAGIVFCMLTLCISLFQIISHYADGKKHTGDFAELAAFVEQAEETEDKGKALQKGGKIFSFYAIRNWQNRTTTWPGGFTLRERQSITRLCIHRTALIFI